MKQKLKIGEPAFPYINTYQLVINAFGGDGNTDDTKTIESKDERLILDYLEVWNIIENSSNEIDEVLDETPQHLRHIVLNFPRDGSNEGETYSNLEEYELYWYNEKGMRFKVALVEN